MKHAIPTTLIALLLATGCDNSPPKQGFGFIAPMDGQTDVSTSAPLLVRTGGLDLPQDYAIPSQFIQVVDLEDGGFVNGVISRDGDDITFVPNKGWQADTRYVWSVSALPALPRAPEHHFPKHLLGEAVFDTAPSSDLLDIVLDAEQERPCALFSRDLLNTTAEVRVTLDDAPIDVTYEILPEKAWDNAYTLLDGDEGVSVVCFDGLGLLEGGESLRLWWNEQGPWQRTLEVRDMAETIQTRRRGK